ncbi:MAG TPA: aminodeoxychorismate synthase component I, partial [Longimicrobiaceae bacterium]|nr:aminodeoxychorismate synthase component I [Longimicrobiaceae bacterium]
LPALRAVEEAVASGLHAAGLLAYEAAPAFDPALVVNAPRMALPLLWFGIFGAREEVEPLPAPAEGDGSVGEWQASVAAPEYHASIARIREWIAAGDTYQVNYTLRLRAPFHGDDLALYARLCQAAGAAYCAYLRCEGFSILSASPELFFRWAEGELELRPMKGTRPRGRWPAEDQALAAELLASPKERAENLMIVDLLRNDAGRISRFGSVEVPRLFEVERYPTVHQLTSTIRSHTRPGATLTDVLRALFPSGSVTGAPKVRSMQIIRELEDTPRGIYTGAIGFVSPEETLFNVAIRTLVLGRASAEVELGVGGGITYDSEAEAEYRECFAKAAFVRHPPSEFDLLETMLYEPGEGLFLLDEHLARLGASAEYFGFVCDAESIRRRLARSMADVAGEAFRVRLLLGRQGEVRIECQPLPAAPPTPLRVCLAAEPVNSADPFLYHKTTQRQLYESRAGARPDCDDVLLINERGELTESTIANLVVRLDGQDWTPPLEAGLLPGVFRQSLLGSGALRERILRPEDLARADGVYLINSVRKWRQALLVS